MSSDLRTESELTWYWLHSADEEQSCIRAISYEGIYIGQLKHPSRAVPTSEAGGTTIDVGLRCGPVYVGKPPAPYREPCVELDRRSLSAQHRSQRIRIALARLAPPQRERLDLAFGQPPGVLRVRGWPVPLLFVLPLANALFRASGTPRRFDSWLTRLVDKQDSCDAVDLDLAAEAQIARDSRAYVAARTGR